MSKAAKVTISVTVAGATTSTVMDRTDEEAVSVSLDLAAGKSGTLTTRTSDTAGVLTVATGHGITTSDVVSVFFTAGVATNFTVSSTTATTITITGGGGTVLPIATSAIIVGVQASNAVAITGNNLKVFQLYCNQRCWVDFRTSAPASVLSHLMEASEGRTYVSGVDLTNPLSEDVVATVHVVNGSTTATTLTIAMLRTTN